MLEEEHISHLTYLTDIIKKINLLIFITLAAQMCPSKEMLWICEIKFSRKNYTNLLYEILYSSFINTGSTRPKNLPTCKVLNRENTYMHTKTQEN